ncbi:hypothetical protein [Paenibacillus campinasensis]|uniref:Lipoprotein n=1 Tax=Paenibacillus campinasensis TaxID=66347 RepID=A0A268EDJ3_9BACL|nr:hypothetical protein [Paenibacillus campinasensis]MUG68742.1 hypothetical protein [Paenibacillus campinasensis]PAD71198.1 hypothetical protein CHH67_25435 [Paenibacillus campinasensis]
MNKKLVAIMLTLLLSVTVVLAGCAKKDEPKAAMVNSLKSATAMTSYEMSSKFVIEDLVMNIAEINTADAELALNVLKNAEVTLDGVYQADPMQAEFKMGINLKGDMAMSFNLDMVMTQEKIYVKVPNIPMLPLPEEVVGKFLVLDLKELAEEAGESFNPATLDAKKSQEFSNEILEAFMSEFDEEKYFKEIAASDVSLPEGIETKQIIQFSINNDNVNEAVELIVNNVLPKILDIIAKEEYRELVGLTQAEIDEARESITSVSQEDLKIALEELNEFLVINSFNINTAIDKKDFPVYQDVTADLVFNDPESSDNMKLVFKGSSHYTKINETAEFKVGIPQDADVVTMEEFEEAMYYGY